MADHDGSPGFEAFWRHHHHEIRRAGSAQARRLSRDRQFIEDVTATGVMKGYVQLRDGWPGWYDTKDSPVGWACTTVQNWVRSAARDLRRQEGRQEGPRRRTQDPNPQDPTAEQALDNLDVERLNDCIARLTGDDRERFVLWAEFDSYRAAAQALGVATMTLYRELNDRIFVQLRRCIEGSKRSI